MRRRTTLRHEFVEYIPGELADGAIYVSIAFGTASHKCMCGCGNEVVTPLSPTDWKVIYDGETISLDPSIGNWSFKCQSHYWIRRNKIEWAASWGRQQIEAGRAHDRLAKQHQYVQTNRPLAGASQRKKGGGIWGKLRNWWGASS